MSFLEIPGGESHRGTNSRIMIAAAVGVLLSSACSETPRKTYDASPTDGGGLVEDAGTDAQGADANQPANHPMGLLGPGLSTLAGYSESGRTDGARDVSLFNNPTNVIVGPQNIGVHAGHIFVADFDNSAIRIITPAGITTTLVQQANFRRPFGMAFTPDGTLYVQTDQNSADQAMGALWSVNLETGAATIERDNFGKKRGIASLSDGRLVASDYLTNTLHIYDPIGKTLTLLAGNAALPGGFADGTGTDAELHQPGDVLVTAADEIFFADTLNHRIRQVTLAGVVTTIAGNGDKGSAGGAALSSSFSLPTGLAVNGETLYVSEFDSGKIRAISGEVRTVTTIAGGPSRGFKDANPPTEGQLYTCEGMDFTPPYLYIADGNGGGDTSYHRIRRISIILQLQNMAP